MTRDEAERTQADVALVHDPDADRLGVLVPDDGGWRALTGNEIGLLLADHVLARTTGEDRLVVDTVVSSSALAHLAAAHEVHHVRTLTGFKWIVRPALDRPELRFVFGYEEALGYSVDAYVRDKDGIPAALAFAALTSDLDAGQRTVTDRLRELAVAHGLFSTDSWVLAGTTRDRIATAMKRLREARPTTIGSFTVDSVEDFATGAELPPTNLLTLTLLPSARLAIRPSGTEAKLKVYAEVQSTVADDAAYEAASAVAATQLEELRAATLPLLEELMIDA
jgi:phosphomannomutase